MTIRHVTIVASPYARHGAGLHVAQDAAGLLKAQNVAVDIIVGEDMADAADLAGKAARGDTDVLAIAGGDGTIRLAVEASIGSGKPLAVIPAGSGNDFARNLHIPLDTAEAVQVILDGHRRPVDLGRVSFPDGRTALFATVAATGFDAAVTARAIDMRRPRGQSRYTIAALFELIALRSRHYQVRVDDDTVEADLIFAAIGNTTSYGGGMKITPKASVSDGQLDVTLAKIPPRFARPTLARVFPKVFAGTHVDHPLVQTMRGAEVELYCDPPALVSVDGDLVGELPAVFEAVPHAIEVFTPPTPAPTPS
ncbi:diacylglycerol/lipid kinase family protein [Gordonia alkanivorans]|uniref:Diacylglycerol kinase n=1 Tax=Gordonia alkanivorans CGMCC 6845 TaxID=1423140 RepID=W9DLQ2_9ACTN|nr:YegS/Rv2252/BmrU family lipid kinase [Gordonia alkanivorans]ETA08230.1 diacylglycerol kinase [Gordonia alkanivorans CGMCC 6845]MDH3012806.1 YegS/Rv2252/BmrU family lipid kinase [Gordonia alkanivorans]MDH3047514.1 YegS/Rv2252/BmrU family lipid kinase [Gordonia alkanivorans]MDJ0028906.1 YegS/Rv2252/BmrU family lipid kinase [Gordonia alkanivorans]